MILLLILISIILAVNMGVSGFSVSFTPSYGSNTLNKNNAALLYTLCVLAGGLLIGPRVVETLTSKISGTIFNPLSGLIIIGVCTLTMFLSNVLNVPQSTSFITVSSFVGAGLYYGNVEWLTILKIMVFAIIFSGLSFVATVLIKRKFYPPHQNNLRFYEKYFVHRNNFRKFIIFTDMYAAFGIGTNNVANVVAPVITSLKVSTPLALLFIAPLFGLGAFFMGGRLIHSFSKDIISFGEFSAVIISFVTATFVIVASLLGLPTPYVQFATFSLLGVSCVKDGLNHTVKKGIVKKIFWIWIIMPLVTVLFSYGLHLFFI